MNIGEGLAALAVPFITFVLGVFTNAMTRRDFRANLKADIEMLAALPDDSQAREVLRDNVDVRVQKMVADDARRVSFGVVTFRAVLWLLSIGVIVIVASNVILAFNTGIRVSHPLFVTTYSVLLFGIALTVLSALLAMVLVAKWVAAWFRDQSTP
jgi:hypothetical protein